MTRERRFALVIIMATAGMNGLITGVLLGLSLLGGREFDVTDLALLVFSIGCFLMAYEVYRLRLLQRPLEIKLAELQRERITLRVRLTAAQATARAVVKLAHDAAPVLPKDRVDD